MNMLNVLNVILMIFQILLIMLVMAGFFLMLYLVLTERANNSDKKDEE